MRAPGQPGCSAPGAWADCAAPPQSAAAERARRQRSLQMKAESSSSPPAAAAPANGAASGGGSAARFIRPHLQRLAPYTPIEPFEILSAKLGRTPDQIIKLDANENPYGPPSEVRQALGAMPYPNIYPDPESRRLRQALAAEHGIPMEHLLVSCGADELIDLLMRACLDPGDAIVDCPPTFTMYAFDAAVNDARVLAVPRLPGFRVDVPGVRRAVLEGGAKMVFLTSPNNPDGGVVAEADLRAVLELPALVVLDEAYIEFSTEASRLRWVETCANLAVLRTFSKSAALAGIRVGYGAFPLDLIQFLWRAKQPYNVSVAAETAAVAALGNPAYLQTTCEALKAERDRLVRELGGISFLRPFPSQANFVLCDVVGRDAGQLQRALAQEHGIMLRHYKQPALAGFIRVSAGKPEHTDALLAALRAMDAGARPAAA